MQGSKFSYFFKINNFFQHVLMIYHTSVHYTPLHTLGKQSQTFGLRILESDILTQNLLLLVGLPSWYLAFGSLGRFGALIWNFLLGYPQSKNIILFGRQLETSSF